MTTSRDPAIEAGPPLPGRADPGTGREFSSLMASRVGDAFVRMPYFVDGATDLVTLCRELSRRGLGDALVRDGDRIGVFTTTDLRDALLRPEPPSELAVREVATFEPWSVSVDDEIFDAMLLMLRHRIHRVVVREGDAVIGVLGQLELMAFVASHSHLIALEAAEAGDLTELGAAAKQIDGLIRVLHRDGVRVDVIAGLVGALNLQVFSRLWELVAPPELRDNSCLIVMGSEGRNEQIIKTDQDNALLLRDGFAFEGLESVTEAFTAALIDFGYPPCPGGIMLSRPLWRQPVAGFRETLRDWIHGADPEGPMNLAIFLDAAVVAGDATLLEDVRTHVDDLVSDSDVFYARFASAVEQFGERLVDAAAGPQRPRRRRDRPEEDRHLPPRSRRADPGAAIPRAGTRHYRPAARPRRGGPHRTDARAGPDRRAPLPHGPEAREQPSPDGRRASARQRYQAERARNAGAARAEGFSRDRAGLQAVAGPSLSAGHALRRRRSPRGPSPQLLIALWGAGMILFNFPMLIVFGRDATVLGLPLLPVAIFAIWAALIGVLAWVGERPATQSPDEGEEERVAAEQWPAER